MKSPIKRNISLISGVMMITLLAACQKFVEVPNPTTKLVTSTVFNSGAAATSALTDIYRQMSTNYESYNMALSTGFLGDELTNYSSSQLNIQYYTNAMTSVNGFGSWNQAYNYIYQANAIIEGLQNNNAIEAQVKSQLTGEAQFIRAFWDFYLVNCYGDIPLVSTTSYTVNSKLSRTSKELVYEQIISDLKDAQNLLNNDYVDATDITITSDRVRPNKWVATALLAKVYLYNNRNSEAEAQATAVINNSSTYSLSSDLNQVFLVNSTEAIWQLAIPQPSPINTYDGQYFILQGPPGFDQPAAISPQLLNAFEMGDKRKVNWIGSYTTTDGYNVTYYYPFKYKSFNSSVITEDNMVIRLAEMYLIRAETKAQQGDAAAVDDLNIIRNRAGLANYNGPTDKASLLAAILRERQVELFTEWGNRWFDMIRTGNINSVMGSPGDVCQYKHGTWNSNLQLFPIPQSDRTNDPILTQNPGY